ncbi:MAG: bifunctional 4-hydroxy-2-oxoglutarate aldolase/2-dehydro-3-deoxy-phosphogluconate aldolase [Terracidiphilus sp.]|jgi:2-dehydro-3-deoxyphosphogluconate aldolase/(4S)-4-hydroxy-2-oxoglutarate aldolase
MMPIATSELHMRLEREGVVPVLTIDRVESALPLADALFEGGLAVAEVTFRAAAAAEVIAKIRSERPAMLVGAGTILTPEHVRQAVDAGAQFGVAPGTNPRVIEEAQRMKLPFAPGVMTPSDIEAALAWGVTVLKFFPAGTAGGVQALKSITAPYAHLGLRFIPTGGVSPENLRQYIELNTVIAAGGTWIATRNDVAEGHWDLIRERCRAACSIVREVRK